MRFLESDAGFRERYLYSNTGYFIAGEVAAKAYGKSWECLIDERRIVPLGMRRSGARYETCPR
ncbi:serine hydrolase [Methanospirillum sp.]|uniref:serine hydrolase n=1 Tax=Methanospirillum sp. TaxID=45200 RepID=UPI002BDBBF17|nr:serine hydrolase [Methanospirillum sp.]HOL40671.1 serine hydrolase [Methanospirillum sp.]HPP76669.1 serine hydrolase [Methanospirillum sp.]